MVYVKTISHTEDEIKQSYMCKNEHQSRVPFRSVRTCSNFAHALLITTENFEKMTSRKKDGKKKKGTGGSVSILVVCYSVKRYYRDTLY